MSQFASGSLGKFGFFWESSEISGGKKKKGKGGKEEKERGGKEGERRKGKERGAPACPPVCLPSVPSLPFLPYPSRLFLEAREGRGGGIEGKAREGRKEGKAGE